MPRCAAIGSGMSATCHMCAAAAEIGEQAAENAMQMHFLPQNFKKAGKQSRSGWITNPFLRKTKSFLPLKVLHMVTVVLLQHNIEFSTKILRQLFEYSNF